MNDKSGKSEDLAERVVKLLENSPLAENLSFFSGTEIELIEKCVPDVNMDTLLLSRNPEPGEGPKVALVEDIHGNDYRVPLRPH